jgi:hypothetical protein
VLVVILPLMEVVFGSDASARPEGFQLNWLRHFGAYRDSNLNWVGHFGVSRRLQLINTGLIPNTSPFCCLFLLCCVTWAALCRRKDGVPKRLVVFRGRRDHLAAEYCAVRR